jgi:hypothetical protein
VRENRTLRLTWRELETWLWLPDCGPKRKRWNYHRHLTCVRLLSTLPLRSKMDVAVDVFPNIEVGERYLYRANGAFSLAAHAL